VYLTSSQKLTRSRTLVDYTEYKKLNEKLTKKPMSMISPVQSSDPLRSVKAVPG